MKNDIIGSIREWKTRRHALVLAHNYVAGEVQDLADFVGDSLELSLRARDAKAPVIVFCGVRFMGETAKILSPESRVFLPVPGAGCPMADMADAAAIRAWRAKHPGAVVVAYVNTTAAAKAETDICCTSANAEKILASIPADRDVLLLPDRNLGSNIADRLGRNIALWEGCCPVHDRVTAECARAARKAHPEAEFLVHLECPPEVAALADGAMSTGGMLKRVRESEKTEFIIGTEVGILHRLTKENPAKRFYPLVPEPVCADMKKITVESLLAALRDLSGEVVLDRELMDRARRPIVKMLEIS